jgi:hypothetical protein
MNNTKSQNGNLYPLTLLVKKIKKISEKSGLTSEEGGAGGVGMAFAVEAAHRGGHGGFLLDQKHKKHIVCVQNIPFPANSGRK